MSSERVAAGIEPGRGRRAALGIAAIVLVLVAVAVSPGQKARSASPRALPARAAPLISDFNGDGFADLAVAEPQESIGSITLAGAVSVFYGSATGSPSPAT